MGIHQRQERPRLGKEPVGVVCVISEDYLMPWPKGKKYSAEHIAKRSATLIRRGTRRKKPIVLEGIEYWRCGTCKIYKSNSEYYEDGKTAVGISSVCKSCHIACAIRTRDPENARQNNVIYMRRARALNPIKFLERDRLAGAKKRKLSPEKVAARNAVNSAVKRGDLVKPKSCENCGQEKRLTGHHDDYTKPLMVRWLCYSCHGKEHRVGEFKRLAQ